MFDHGFAPLYEWIEHPAGVDFAAFRAACLWADEEIH
jgi:hypothetical protein